jgi:CPA1 family monovalent cation:H+ antiporter
MHVVANANRFRYELIDGGELAGFIDYRVRDGRYWLIHTEIDEGHAGTGAASFLVRQTLDMLRERGVKIVPTCPFVGGWIRRHKEYSDLVDTETLTSFKRSRNAGRRRVVKSPPFDPDGRSVGDACSHMPSVTSAVPEPWPADGCADCLAAGKRDWVHLRACVSCGHVGCCDSSPGRHATAHHHQSTHPLVRSHEAGERWWYCYVDAVTFDLDRHAPVA